MKPFLTKPLWAILLCCFAMPVLAQLSQNNNKTLGATASGTTQGLNSADWIYGIRTLPSGAGYVTTGYSMQNFSSGLTTFDQQAPSIVKYNASGTLIWEHSYPCIAGIGVDIYDMPNGYLVIGIGGYPGSCNYNARGFFSMQVDKTTGAIDPAYGIKWYNAQTLPFPAPANGLPVTLVGELGEGKARSCPLYNGGSTIIGFMICGNYMDNNTPNHLTLGTAGATNGCFLLQIDAQGFPVTSFGSSGTGMEFYFQNSGSQYYCPHLHNVCPHIAPDGSLQGWVVVGSINENTSIVPASCDLENDAMVFMVNTNGTSITFVDVYDEATHLKTGTPASLPYTDNADIGLCTNSMPPAYNLPQENNNERATRVQQVKTGGDFIILTQFDWAVNYYGSACAVTYPSTGFFISCDAAIMKMDPTGNITWIKNVFQNTGADFENNLLLDAVGNVILVQGSAMTEPDPGTPIEQQVLLSKLNLTTGASVYDYVYQESGGSQTMICPFAFDFDGSGGVIIGGDNELNGDDYELIGVNPY